MACDVSPVAMFFSSYFESLVITQVMGGKAYCVVHKQGLFTIDINGQMDEQDTGKLPDDPGRSENPNYEGPPIHTLTVFANPFIEDEPDIFGEGVLAIEPGEEVPTEGNWQTLYFMPGLHHVGLNFRLHSNRLGFGSLQMQTNCSFISSQKLLHTWRRCCLWYIEQWGPAPQQ